MTDYKAYILEHFRYNNGVITRDDRNNSNGSIDKYGYLIIKVKGKQFKAHHICWLLNYGEFPAAEIDHINRIKTDNRIENLRESNRLEQSRNITRKINKDTGVCGIYLDKTRGLNKKYAFKSLGKTYRSYTVDEALNLKRRIYNETYI